MEFRWTRQKKCFKKFVLRWPLPVWWAGVASERAGVLGRCRQLEGQWQRDSSKLKYQT